MRLVIGFMVSLVLCGGYGMAQNLVSLSGIDPYITTGPSLTKERVSMTGDTMTVNSLLACKGFYKVYHDIKLKHNSIQRDLPKDYRLHVVFRMDDRDYDFWIHSGMSMIEDSFGMYKISRRNRMELKTVISRHCPQVFGGVRFKPNLDNSGITQ